MPLRTLDVVLELDESRTWVATVPALPGCVSQGTSKKAARKSIREAIALHVEAHSKDVEEPVDRL